MATILVVDDDEQLCTLVARLLTAAGHEVSLAMSGGEALEQLGSRTFDVMLLDLVMPGKGGIETIMEIRTISPGLPIIVMSGQVTFGDASITRLVEHYGALAVLSKPFSSDELNDAVTAALA